MGPEIIGRGIPSDSIEHLRSILINSLPEENVGHQDRKLVENLKRVKFKTNLGEICALFKRLLTNIIMLKKKKLNRFNLRF